MAHTPIQKKRGIFSKNARNSGTNGTAPFGKEMEPDKHSKPGNGGPSRKVIELSAVAALMMFDADSSDLAGLKGEIGGIAVVIEDPNKSKSHFITEGNARKHEPEELRK
ncbi:MAG: hypothetical protein ABII71_05250 [Candidatus Micrarchaeota archaeon]